MANKPGPEKNAQRSGRLAQKALARIEDSAEEERALDAAVKRSIKLHGA